MAVGLLAHILVDLGGKEKVQAQRCFSVLYFIVLFFRLFYFITGCCCLSFIMPKEWVKLYDGCMNR